MFKKNLIFLLSVVTILSSALNFKTANASIKAPEFSQADLTGKTQSLSAYKGQYLILYFWATWCPACRADIQNLQNLYQKYSAKGVGFVSVSLDTDITKLEKFVAKQEIRFPVLFDGRGWKNGLAMIYGIDSTPTYVLIDSDQNVIALENRNSKIERLLRRKLS